MKKRVWMLVAMVLAMTLLFTACGEEPKKTEEKPATTENAEKTEPEKKEGEAAEKDEKPAESGENSVEAIKKRGKLVVGTSADYPPYEFHTLIDGKDQIVGFDISLAKYIAEELGVELEVVDMAFESLLIGLETGKFDIVIAAMNPDPERNVNFSKVYYTATHGILTMKNKLGDFTTKEALAGKKLGVQIGTVQEKIGEGIEGAEIKGLPLITNLNLELTTGKIDGIIMEVPVAESYAKVNTDLTLVPNIEWGDESQGSAVAMAKGDDVLTEEINRILDKMKGENLLEKWIIEANELNEQAPK